MPSFRVQAGSQVPGPPHLAAEAKSWAVQHTPIPKYYQLRSELGRQIADGRLQPGAFLQPERVLLQQYGVSRTTLREALRPLLLEGTLVSVRGKGIMVAHQAIRQSGDVLMSFSDVMRAQGMTPGIRDVRVAVVRCSHDVGAALELPPEAPVVQVERVRTGDDRPVNHSVSFLPAEAVPDFSAGALRASGSLYQVLKTQYEIHIARARDEMWARRATRREAQLLGIRAGDPVLVLQRVSALASGRPIEYALSVIRSDNYRYVVRLTPPRPASPG